eukprot:7386210-Prymnesium_polylepis.1
MAAMIALCASRRQSSYATFRRKAFPQNAFFDLAELDLATSADGRSPDAQCISSCYGNSFAQLQNPKFALSQAADEEEAEDTQLASMPFLRRGDWMRSLVALSVDGASVMLGHHRGTVALIKAQAKHLLAVHAAAHVSQLANSDAFMKLDYYSVWRDLIQQLFVYYSGSGKKRFSVEEIANLYGFVLRKLQTTQGIRWAAAQANAVKAIIVDLPAIVLDLESSVKADLGIEFSVTTPSDKFIGKKFFKLYEPEDGGRATRWLGTVTSMVVGANSTLDKFEITFRNKQVLEGDQAMPKAELVDALCDDKQELLRQDDRWLLRESITDYRFVVFTHFMLDLHTQLAIFSKGNQAKSLIISDLTKNINNNTAALRKLKDSPGVNETAFNAKMAETEAADVWPGIGQLYDGEEGRRLFLEDRVVLLEHVSTDITIRFGKVLSDPHLQAFAVFEKRFWPEKLELLDKYGNSQIELLFKNFESFFDDATLEDVLEHWRLLK